MRLARPIFVFMLATFGAAHVSNALPIAPIIVDPPLGNSAFALNLPFTALNGTAVNGQALSLDFIFSDEKWIAASSSNHGVLLMLQTTNVGPVIPTDVAGTGSFLDHGGNSIGGPMSLYQGTTNNGGLLAASLYSGAAMNLLNPIVGPFRYYGLHYDITLPTMGATTITSAQLRVIQSDFVSVPDHGSSLAMLAIAIVLLVVTRNSTHG